MAGIAAPFAGTPVQAVDALEVLLKSAVQQQMMADVPLGAFLSGGIDSSTIVALMQAQSSRPVKSFTIGFVDDPYNETRFATAVARYLGTDHTEMQVTSSEATAVIARLPTLYDEPFADSSQIPTFLVSQLARQQVTVSLSGDGGDELFGGYNRYTITHKFWKNLSHIPRPLRQLIAYGLMALPPHVWNRLTARSSMSSKWANLGEKLHKGAMVMNSATVEELYQRVVSQWNDPRALVQGGAERTRPLTEEGSDQLGWSDTERMMLMDLLTYLPNDILTKLDRAAMGVSLETRVPFLDHRVVEFAWRLPMQYKLRSENSGLSTKWALRQVLYRYVPEHLLVRPKTGFGVPIDDWLRGPLRDWAEDLLNESRLKREGYLNPAPVRHLWSQHLSGRHNRQHQLWTVLMFQAWLAEQRR